MIILCSAGASSRKQVVHGIFFKFSNCPKGGSSIYPLGKQILVIHLEVLHALVSSSGNTVATRNFQFYGVINLARVRQNGKKATVRLIARRCACPNFNEAATPRMRVYMLHFILHIVLSSSCSSEKSSATEKSKDKCKANF